MAGIFTKRIWQPSPAASTAFVANSHLVPASLPVGRQK